MTIQPYRPLELMMDEKITKCEVNDFIAVWENFVPANFCDTLVKYFEDIMNNRCSVVDTEFSNVETNEIVTGEHQYRGSLNRKDISMLINYANPTYTYQINQFLQSCVLHYINIFDQLSKVPMLSSDIKIQKTPPGGGYHLWHYENASPSHSQRELTWMVYLNDVPEGEGETEFLYQKRRIKPTKGTVVIFPAGMTHVHKGNTVFTQDKYIITGWYIKTGK
jgi:hypothetical protein